MMQSKAARRYLLVVGGILAVAAAASAAAFGALRLGDCTFPGWGWGPGRCQRIPDVLGKMAFALLFALALARQHLGWALLAALVPPAILELRARLG